MRIGISGTHGTGKTTLVQALCAHMPGHVAADEPYCLLEEEGYEFGIPPSPEDYRALLARSVRSLSSPLLPAVVFDRTPLDYLAYLAATGADLPGEAGAVALRQAFVSLDLLVITLITPETEQVLPVAEMPGLRAAMNDALLELVYDDPLGAWGDNPVLELSGPLEGRLDAVLAALNQIRSASPCRLDTAGCPTMHVERNVAQPYLPERRRAGGESGVPCQFGRCAAAAGSSPSPQRYPVPAAPPVSEPYCMAAATMSLELHDCGIHAVWTGRTGQRAAYQLVPVMLKRHKSLSGRTAAHAGNELTCSLPHRDEPPATS